MMDPTRGGGYYTTVADKIKSAEIEVAGLFLDINNARGSIAVLKEQAQTELASVEGTTEEKKLIEVKDRVSMIMKEVEREQTVIRKKTGQITTLIGRLEYNVQPTTPRDILRCRKLATESLNKITGNQN